jgi:hypothetical protein
VTSFFCENITWSLNNGFLLQSHRLSAPALTVGPTIEAVIV